MVKPQFFMTSLTKRLHSTSCTYLRYKLTTTILVPAELSLDQYKFPRSRAPTSVEDVSSGKLFATMLLHIPYCEKLIFGQRPAAKSTQKVGPRPTN